MITKKLPTTDFSTLTCPSMPCNWLGVALCNLREENKTCPSQHHAPGHVHGHGHGWWHCEPCQKQVGRWWRLEQSRFPSSPPLPLPPPQSGGSLSGFVPPRFSDLPLFWQPSKLCIWGILCFVRWCWRWPWWCWLQWWWWRPPARPPLWWLMVSQDVAKARTRVFSRDDFLISCLGHNLHLQSGPSPSLSFAPFFAQNPSFQTSPLSQNLSFAQNVLSDTFPSLIAHHNSVSWHSIRKSDGQGSQGSFKLCHTESSSLILCIPECLWMDLPVLVYLRISLWVLVYLRMSQRGVFPGFAHPYIKTGVGVNENVKELKQICFREYQMFKLNSAVKWYFSMNYYILYNYVRSGSNPPDLINLRVCFHWVYRE